MAMMDVQDFVKAVMTAALVFGDKYRRDHEAEEEDRATLTESEKEEQTEEFPEEQEETEFWEEFVSDLEAHGLSHFNHIAVAGEDAGKVIDRILNKTKPA